MNKEFTSFESARDFVRKLKLQSVIEWKQYCKSGNKPDDIPSWPNEVYLKKGWKDWGDFLGTGRIADKNKVFCTYDEAKKIVHKLKLKGEKEWREYRKSGNKPDNIPSSPHSTYKNKGWKSMGDWLGTGNVAPKDRQFISFEDAREFVRKLKLKGEKEWREYRKSGNKPDDIPSNPNQVYKKTNEWKGMGDWLGTGNVTPKDRKYRSFSQAKQFVQSLKLKNQNEWKEYSKSNQRPNDIPSHPHIIYKNEWKSLGDFLGTGTIASFLMEFRSFNDARKFVHSLGLTGVNDWKKYCASGNKPDDIPFSPDSTYKNKGWKSMGDWLGTGNIPIRDRTYLSFSQAKQFIQSLGLKNRQEWREYSKSKSKPDNLPSYPDKIYKNQGWKSMGDWLGTGIIATRDKKYRSFSQAKQLVQSLGLKNYKDWQKYYKSGNKPDDISASPWNTYKNQGWINFGDWLGTGNISVIVKSKNYLSFNEAKIQARELAKKYNIKNLGDWKKAVKEGKIPDNIPRDPTIIYSKNAKNEK